MIKAKKWAWRRQCTNSFCEFINAVHLFTALQTEIILMMRTYYNNNKNLNKRADETRNIISPKEINFWFFWYFFIIIITVIYLVFFSNGCFFSIKAHWNNVQSFWTHTQHKCRNKSLFTSYRIFVKRNENVYDTLRKIP